MKQVQTAKAEREAKKAAEKAERGASTAEASKAGASGTEGSVSVGSASEAAANTQLQAAHAEVTKHEQVVAAELAAKQMWGSAKRKVGHLEHDPAKDASNQADKEVVPMAAHAEQSKDRKGALKQKAKRRRVAETQEDKEARLAAHAERTKQVQAAKIEREAKKAAEKAQRQAAHAERMKQVQAAKAERLAAAMTKSAANKRQAAGAAAGGSPRSLQRSFAQQRNRQGAHPGLKWQKHGLGDKGAPRNYFVPPEVSQVISQQQREIEMLRAQQWEQARVIEILHQEKPALSQPYQAYGQPAAQEYNSAELQQGFYASPSGCRAAYGEPYTPHASYSYVQSHQEQAHQQHQYQQQPHQQSPESFSGSLYHIPGHYGSA